MIDNIKINKTISPNEKAEILKRTNLFKEVYKGGIVTNSMIKNIKIRWGGDTFMQIDVSLPTFKYGHNLYSLNYYDVIEVIKSIEDTIGIKLGNCKISRIDISQNFIVNDFCDFYFNALLYKEKYYIHQYPTGRSFYNKDNSSAICFYDKTKQFNNVTREKKVIEIIPEFVNKNVLRYEYRMSKNLTSILNQNEVLLKDLYDKNFYNNLIRIWLSKYLSIVKSKNEIVGKGLCNMSELKDYLAFVGANSLGGEASVKQMIDVIKKENGFTSAVQPHRMLKMLSNLYRNGYLCRINQHVKELNNLVMDAAMINYV